MSSPTEVTLKLFASLAEAQGWRERKCEITAGQRIIDLWCAATGQIELPPRVLCARNMDYCEASTRVCAGDEIAFFPPVTGGAHGR